METKIKKEKEKNLSQGKKRVLEGVITSTKMQDTVVVLVERYVKHSKYEKYRVISKKYKADSKGGEYKVGEKVKIEECRPISKDKKFKIVESL